MIYPSDGQTQHLAPWLGFTIIYVSAKLVGYAGYKSTAGMLFSVLGVVAPFYTLSVMKRPVKLSIEDVEEERRPLLAPKAEE